MPDAFPMYQTFGSMAPAFQRAASAQASGGDQTPAVPSSPRQEAIQKALLDLTTEVSTLAVLGMATEILFPLAAPIALGATEVYSIVHGAMQVGLVSFIPERDIAPVQKTFGMISLSGRASAVAVAIVRSNRQVADSLGQTSDELSKFVEAVIDFTTAISELKEKPQDLRAMNSVRKATNELFETWNTLVEKYIAENRGKEKTVIPGLRLIGDYGLPTLDDHDVPRAPQSHDNFDSDEDDFFDDEDSPDESED